MERRRCVFIWRSAIAICGCIFLLCSCSNKTNTAQTRFWQSFTARYNTYYNGNLAYIDGSLDKEKGNEDDYTDIIPLYTVTNKKSRTIGSGNFDRAIEKCEKAIKQHSIKKRPEWKKNRKKTDKDKEWLGRREYNPFIWKAWYMMGRSQFMKGEFEEAAATFAYMYRLFETQPRISGIAQTVLRSRRHNPQHQARHNYASRQKGTHRNACRPLRASGEL